MIKPWVFDLADFPEGRDPVTFDAVTASKIMKWQIDLWTRAEQMGFHGVFLSEHHFQTGSLAPSPNLLLAALAARTKRIRLGVLGVIVPMYTPWRVAEEAAMLDLMTQGRIDLGLVRGLGPLDLARVGIDAGTIQPEFEEACEVIEKALTTPIFDYAGEHFRYEKLAILPRPIQKPIPIWMTAQTTKSAARAAVNGHKLCTARLPIADLAAVGQAYRDAAANAGTESGPDQLGLRRNVIIGSSRAEALEIAEEALEKLLIRQGGPNSPNAPLIRARTDHLVGSPSDVLDQIVDQCRAIGAGHFLSLVPATMSHDQIEQHYRLYAEQVIPRLKTIDVANDQRAQAMAG
jgi:alkanesulfonate monooxygenase SsuD/methylene tetrahydromethanopterin reductase-like flavin-dependent oxidoreductase (luciferase family)